MVNTKQVSHMPQFPKGNLGIKERHPWSYWIAKNWSNSGEKSTSFLQVLVSYDSGSTRISQDSSMPTLFDLNDFQFMTVQVTKL